MSPTRTWIMTGGNAGLGFQCCRFLAQQPSSLIVIPCRDARKGAAAAQRLRREGGAAEVLPAAVLRPWREVSAEMTGLPSSLCCPCPTYLSDLARA